MRHTYRSNGKILLTGEYLVLYGAKALALPTNYGQTMEVIYNKSKSIRWTSLDKNGEVWFKYTFKISDLLKNTIKSADKIAQRLLHIFFEIQRQNTLFFKKLKGCDIVTQLDFPKDWGLGSSSTLLSNLSRWTNTNPYQINTLIFKGSGYDIACANVQQPILFQNMIEKNICPVDFLPHYKDQLFFVYLNKKQSSLKAIKKLDDNKIKKAIRGISEIDDITKALLKCGDLELFKTLLSSHEAIISQIINRPTVKEIYFKDFKGGLKSLGAWGGDFILAAAEKSYVYNYFSSKGFPVIIDYKKMIKNSS